MSYGLYKIDLNDLRPMREIVIEKLRKAVLDGTLKCGDRLKESHIADMLGVSRTPVREAFRQLETEGLAVNIPRRGTVVKGISLKDVIEIYEIREMLEGLAARLACKNMNSDDIKLLKQKICDMDVCIERNNTMQYIKLHKDFNEIIINASNNKRLIHTMEQMHEYLMSFRNVSLINEARRLKALEEYETIVKAIENRDEEMAEKLTREHIIKAKNYFIKRNYDKLTKNVASE